MAKINLKSEVFKKDIFIRLVPWELGTRNNRESMEVNICVSEKDHGKNTQTQRERET